MMITDDCSPPSRRQFAHTITLLAAGGFAATGLAADDKADLPDAKAFAQAMTTVVRYRFGKHLNEAQLNRVALSVRSAQGRSESLKKTQLANSDDPSLAFRADLP